MIKSGFKATKAAQKAGNILLNVIDPFLAEVEANLADELNYMVATGLRCLPLDSLTGHVNKIPIPGCPLLRELSSFSMPGLARRLFRNRPTVSHKPFLYIKNIWLQHSVNADTLPKNTSYLPQ